MRQGEGEAGDIGGGTVGNVWKGNRLGRRDKGYLKPEVQDYHLTLAYSIKEDNVAKTSYLLWCITGQAIHEGLTL